ncbi:glutathione S-transferase [Catenovulum agarivorans DS-2]|uniref:Glutathione S-transferase n=1 Tax=Catenovulum agarivorans DS-2 TaxID=1328313 RepID=W7QBR1_9ALTE|nr:glutathione S-transferase C-terminal domain-containing protein [Catenovulum agarivorans]EWH09431.1 glutathione S-transferase [Catenovulum agarivorans DS-2]
MLRNGKWVENWQPIQQKSEDGDFIRQSSGFRQGVVKNAPADRYHLYVAYICPWACRTLMLRKLKGLEHAISVSVVNPVLTEQGWAFDSPEQNLQKDYMHQLYTHSDNQYTGRATVPVLWDKYQQKIVNNESADIIKILNDDFNHLAQNDINLRPTHLLEEMSELNELIYDKINNGVYRAGFASTQQAYERGYYDVFTGLDTLEEKLAHRKYLLGEQLTEADIRLFVTLIRFDLAYYSVFKCNKQRIRDYQHLHAYMHRVYNLPGIKQTVNAQHIKQGYYSIKTLNPNGIVPLGPDQI